MNKTAVDKATKEYWDNYFMEYGQMWTRDIPRRIKTAMVRTRNIEAKTADGTVVPLAHNVSEDGTLSLEAAFKGDIDGAPSVVLVTAEFNEHGRMLKFEANRVK